MEDKTESSADSGEFLKRYAGQIAGQLGYWDRLVVTGTLVDVGYSGHWLGVLWRQHPQERMVVFATYLGSVEMLGAEIDRAYPGQGARSQAILCWEFGRVRKQSYDDLLP